MFPFDDVIMMFQDVHYHPFMHWNVEKNHKYIFPFSMIALPWYDVKSLNLLYMKIKSNYKNIVWDTAHIVGLGLLPDK